MDPAELAEALGVPVVPTSARRGEGLLELKDTVDDLLTGALLSTPRPVTYDPELEACLARLEEKIRGFLAVSGGRPSTRWVALRLLGGDPEIIEKGLSWLSPEGFREAGCSRAAGKKKAFNPFRDPAPNTP